MRGQRPKKPRHKRREPRHHGLIIARERGPAKKPKLYAGPTAGTIVVWCDGKFTVKPSPTGHGFARMPDGLASRVKAALNEGKAHG